MTSMWKLVLLALAVGGILAACLWYGLRESKERSVAAYAAGYEEGIGAGLRIAAAVEPLTNCSEAARVPDVALLAECRATFADYRRTEAANRANARELGLNEGLRLGREDWYACGAWEPR